MRKCVPCCNSFIATIFFLHQVIEEIIQLIEGALQALALRSQLVGKAGNYRFQQSTVTLRFKLEIHLKMHLIYVINGLEFRT